MKEVKIKSEKNSINHAFSHSTAFFNYLLHRQKRFLPLLAFLILLIPFIINYSLGKPLLSGSESYYHLSLAQEHQWFTLNYLFLLPLISYIPLKILWIIPLLMGIISIIFFQNILHKLKVEEKFIFFFILLLIASPFFIHLFTTISSNALFLIITTLGFLLLTRENKYNQFAIIPFIVATFFDLLSTIILLLTLIIYFWNNKTNDEEKKHNSKERFICLSIITSLLLVHFFILNQPLSLGPFHSQETIPDFISDLGGLSGISFFVFLLLIIGISITWKNKSFGKAYLYLPFIIPIYLYSTQTIMTISIITILFATIGLVGLLERKWLLRNIRNFTFLLLFLGVLFSLLTYLNRSSDFSPSLSDQKSLTWIKDNTAPESIVFSGPENAEYITYFTKHLSFSSINADKTKKNTTIAILSSNYIQELFPLLEENNITIIYINTKTKEKLSKEQGLLFLLKNERFKLVHSYDESEVWMFLSEKKEKEFKK